MKFMSRMVRVEGAYPPLSVDNIKDPVALTKALCKITGETKEFYYDYPRCSQIGSLCSREWVLGMNSNIKKSEFIHNPLRIIFNIGTAIHHYFQNNKSLFPNIIGRWHCLGCGYEFNFGVRPKGGCPGCGASNRAIQYREHSFILDNPFYLSGHIDLFLPIGNPVRYRMGDIKGVADDKVEPRGNDIMQLATYLLSAKYDESLPKNVDTTTGYLFYISKKMSYKAPIRTIKVVLTPTLEETITELLMQIKKGIDEDKIPPRRINCKDKNCPFIVQCKELGDRNDFK